MFKIITPAIQSTLNVLKRSSYSILPFTESRREDDLKQDAEAAKNSAPSLSATDLFSFFTADIIKQEVVFTR